MLNKNQGLGFVLFGIVLDKRYFFSLLVNLGALGATVLTTLLAFRHDVQTDASTGTSCGLTKEQEVAAQSMFTTFNATCTWNLTIGPAGVIVN